MKNIVTVGGGTGSYTVLSGLKNIDDVALTALVSMADNGGSTGILRDELGVLPVGDVRQCLVALSEHSEIVRELMSYRFSSGTLEGHSFGNIFLAALEKVTGDFVKGVEIASEILKVKGNVIPVTKNKAQLFISLCDGKKFEGENDIQNANLQSVCIESISYKDKVLLNEHARIAILVADYIILGPGNYFCSLIPNLIVDGFKEAIQKSKAKIIFPVNLTNKLDHTTNWKVGDYVKDVERYLNKKVDFILVNSQKPSPEQIKLYELEEGKGVLVENDLKKDKRVTSAKLLSTVVIKPQHDKAMKVTRGFIRHDSDKLAKCIQKIIEK